jgi:hypothetical protein
MIFFQGADHSGAENNDNGIKSRQYPKVKERYEVPTTPETPDEVT